MNLVIIVFLVLSVLPPTLPCCSCLPAGVKGTDPVNYLRVKPGSAGLETRKQYVSVADKLAELKAKCRKGKLLDVAGRQIRFFQMTGCWGNPPENYQEILDAQAKELARLKKRYTVIEMTCNRTGVLIS